MKTTLLVPSKQPYTRKITLLFEFEILLPISLFPVTKFELPVTNSNFFDFLRSFELSGVDYSHHNLCKLRNRPLEPAPNEAHVGNPRLQAIFSSLATKVQGSKLTLANSHYAIKFGNLRVRKISCELESSTSPKQRERICWWSHQFASGKKSY